MMKSVHLKEGNSVRNTKTFSWKEKIKKIASASNIPATCKSNSVHSFTNINLQLFFQRHLNEPNNKNFIEWMAVDDNMREWIKLGFSNKKIEKILNQIVSMNKEIMQKFNRYCHLIYMRLLHCIDAAISKKISFELGVFHT